MLELLQHRVRPRIRYKQYKTIVEMLGELQMYKGIQGLSNQKCRSDWIARIEWMFQDMPAGREEMTGELEHTLR